ncbi:MAG: hypothetical protein ACPGRZ_14000 [Alphaproteobacteria bacterium]
MGYSNCINREAGLPPGLPVLGGPSRWLLDGGWITGTASPQGRGPPPL